MGKALQKMRLHLGQHQSLPGTVRQMEWGTYPTAACEHPLHKSLEPASGICPVETNHRGCIILCGSLTSKWHSQCKQWYNVVNTTWSSGFPSPCTSATTDYSLWGHICNSILTPITCYQVHSCQRGLKAASSQLEGLTKETVETCPVFLQKSPITMNLNYSRIKYSNSWFVLSYRTFNVTAIEAVEASVLKHKKKSISNYKNDNYLTYFPPP